MFGDGFEGSHIEIVSSDSSCQPINWANGILLSGSQVKVCIRFGLDIDPLRISGGSTESSRLCVSYVLRDGNVSLNLFSRCQVILA